MADDGPLGQIAEERLDYDGQSRPNSSSMPERFPSMAVGGSERDNIETWLDPYPDMSLDRMEAMLETQRINNGQLKRATNLFEREYEQQKAREIELGHEVVETKILEMAFGSKKARSSRRGVGARKRASQRAQGKTQRAGPIPLTATQKATIVASHFQIIERQAQHGIQVLEDTIDHLVANIDALEEDHKDYAHDVKKFDRTMQPHAITHKFSTDIFKHYADDKAKHLSGQIEGLRLRGHIARNANRDAIERLSSLGDMEGSITRVDFDQIKIRNEQYVAVLSQCNIDLVEEKMKTSHSDKTQNKYLEALREKQVATDIVNSSMADVARMSKRLVREYKAVVEECEINKRANKRLRKQVAAWKVPAVITYVADQAKADETKKAISSWQHRVQVAGFEVKKHKRAWLVVAKQAQMIR